MIRTILLMCCFWMLIGSSLTGIWYILGYFIQDGNFKVLVAFLSFVVILGGSAMYEKEYNNK